ncbi:hypothetical protein GCM10027449_18370 [Sinomonas notoginsengisoli]
MQLAAKFGRQDIRTRARRPRLLEEDVLSKRRYRAGVPRGGGLLCLMHAGHSDARRVSARRGIGGVHENRGAQGQVVAACDLDPRRQQRRVPLCGPLPHPPGVLALLDQPNCLR